MTRHNRLVLAVVIGLLMQPITGLPSVAIVAKDKGTSDVPAAVCDVVLSCSFFPDAHSAFGSLPAGSGVLVLADGYPLVPTTISDADWGLAASKKLRVYVELPAGFPAAAGISVAKPSLADYYHRAVVSNNQSSVLPLPLPNLAIGMPQGSYFVAMSLSLLPDSVLVYDQVAGSETAAFGLTPSSGQNPLLWATNDAKWGPPVLVVAATCFSNLIRARYAPQYFWEGVWSGILSAIVGQPVTFPPYDPIVRPRMARGTPVKPTDIQEAFMAATNWLANASSLIVTNNVTACPAPYAAPGDNVTCVLEGFSSRILYTGQQALASSIRTDCNAETAMAIGLHANLTGNPESAATSKAILRYIFNQSVAIQGPRGNSSSSAYGLFAWGMSSPSWINVFYGDDNARVILASLVGRAALSGAMSVQEQRTYDEAILRAVIGNVRTTSVHGFRPGRIDLDDLLSKGWEYYRQSNYVYQNASTPQPHYQSYLWCTYLAVSSATGCQACLSAAKAGINQTMSVLMNNPTEFYWTEYLSEEIARMFLPIAFLVRADGDKPQYRAWLSFLADKYIVGREFLGQPGKCTTCPPKTNAAYGKGEGALIQSNADEVADLLYSVNFAASGLGEAAAATGDPNLQAKFQESVDFLTRVQATSSALPFVDGAHMRAFDTRLWEAYGSATDWGWGPWSVETGWTEGWVAASMWSSITGQSLWDLAVGETLMDASMLADVCSVMMPNDPSCA